ncbi:hypothetical protein CYR55_22575 [Chimaeribacter californicus]|uniref:Type II toxin-antitoxin system RelE/ParE family toxin n=1 Tax=Chimaeribacter californicus TaxID=2060067 RepID=A0A2N5DTN2_9GAMM|nr:type II toxin-antitoxin system RelE/ParE family toxin [Chimaeribacter californicus]PLR29841.1 hypothetical protein CYR55_22575 [Chimaeribacter californicus]
MPNVKWTNKAQKQLRNIDSGDIEHVYEEGNALKNFPNVKKDIKALKGKGRKYRLRVGNYRLIFAWVKGDPVIIQIQAVLRRTSRTY